MIHRVSFDAPVVLPWAGEGEGPVSLLLKKSGCVVVYPPPPPPLPNSVSQWKDERKKTLHC